ANTETPGLAPVASSAAFIGGYQHARRPFSEDELEVAWAARVWPAADNARAEALFGQQPVAGAALREQAVERLARAGA
ncbi:MAG: hypothetical protein ACR2P2_13495, partial [Nakamurella sp.]